MATKTKQKSKCAWCDLRTLHGWSLGKEIKHVRQLAGLTQIELSDRCGLVQSHISEIEHDKRVPDDEQLGRLAKALRLPVSHLVKHAR